MIGYKKICAFSGFKTYPAVATLFIPDDAKKCNPKAGNKWRCDRAKVLKIESLDGNTLFNMGRSCICTERGICGVMYHVDRYVKPRNGFDEDNTIECGKGIHYFLTKQEAKEYYTH